MVREHHQLNVLNLSPFFLFIIGVQARIGKPAARKGGSNPFGHATKNQAKKLKRQLD
jgi:hypothetical protein